MRTVAVATVVAVLAMPAAARAQDSGLPLGTVAPSAILQTLDGKTVDLAQVAKGPSVIEFWATWCENCEHLLPAMQRAQALYGKKEEDMFRDEKGQPIGDRDVSIHAIAQYVYIRRDYFPEIPHPKLAAAVAKLDARLASVTARVAAAGDPEKKREADHTYRYPGLSPIRPPEQPGPSGMSPVPPTKT